MLLILALLFALAWVTGFVVFHVSVAAIHLLLFVAVVAFVVHLFRGGRAAPVA
jgi:hypothetical protein